MKINENTAIQAIDLDALQRTLKGRGQKLEWDPQMDQPTAETRNSEYRTYQLLLTECDRNKDGSVSKSEWESGKGDWKWLFPFIDVDQDGTITKEEYDSFQQYKAKHPDWSSRIRKQ